MAAEDRGARLIALLAWLRSPVAGPAGPSGGTRQAVVEAFSPTPGTGALNGTWSKPFPTEARWIRALLFAGGGAGGGGAKAADNVDHTGGGGGQAGGWVAVEGPASSFNDTMAYSIGDGGLPGAGDNGVLAGAAGGPGMAAVFGPFYCAGGEGGAAGTRAGTQALGGRAQGNGTGIGQGGDGTNVIGGGGTDGGGGGGGGITAAGAISVPSGGAGGKVLPPYAPAAGGLGGFAGTDVYRHGGAGLPSGDGPLPSRGGGGGGGAAGKQAGVTVPGDGASGAFPGGGGGGGGAGSTNGNQDGGASGRGGVGALWVATFFS